VITAAVQLAFYAIGELENCRRACDQRSTDVAVAGS
jgi:hypothetical protein